MKQMFVRIKETVAEKLRGLCAELSPEKRMLTVIVLAVLFALGNFYLIFRAIYDIGREDVQRDIIEIAPLDIPDIVPADTIPDEKCRKWKISLTNSIRTKMSNNADKLRQRLEIRKYLVLQECSFSSLVRCGSSSHRLKRTDERRKKCGLQYRTA